MRNDLREAIYGRGSGCGRVPGVMLAHLCMSPCLYLSAANPGNDNTSPEGNIASIIAKCPSSALCVFESS